MLMMFLVFVCLYHMYMLLRFVAFSEVELNAEQIKRLETDILAVPSQQTQKISIHPLSMYTLHILGHWEQTAVPSCICYTLDK